MGSPWICGHVGGFVSDRRTGLCVREGGRADVHFVDSGGISPTNEICRGSRVSGLGVPG